MRKAIFAVVALGLLALAPAAFAVPVKYEETIKRPVRTCGDYAGGTKINVDPTVLFHCADVERKVVKKKVKRVKHVAPDPAPVETEPTYVEGAAPAPAPAPATTSSGGCPSYMAGEASSPDAVNPTSGASGCYQVLPSTAAAMGSACADVNSSSCVAAICAAQGNDAWVAADPCGYVGARSEDG